MQMLQPVSSQQPKRAEIHISKFTLRLHDEKVYATEEKLISSSQ